MGEEPDGRGRIDQRKGLKGSDSAFPYVLPDFGCRAADTGETASTTRLAEDYPDALDFLSPIPLPLNALVNSYESGDTIDYSSRPGPNVRASRGSRNFGEAKSLAQEKR